MIQSNGSSSTVSGSVLSWLQVASAPDFPLRPNQLADAPRTQWRVGELCIDVFTGRQFLSLFPLLNGSFWNTYCV